MVTLEESLLKELKGNMFQDMSDEMFEKIFNIEDIRTLIISDYCVPIKEKDGDEILDRLGVDISDLHVFRYKSAIEFLKGLAEYSFEYNTRSIDTITVIFKDTEGEVSTDTIGSINNSLYLDVIAAHKLFSTSTELVLLIKYRDGINMHHLMYVNPNTDEDIVEIDGKVGPISKLTNKIYAGIKGVAMDCKFYDTLDKDKVEKSLQYAADKIVKFMLNHKDIKHVDYYKVDMDDMTVVPADVISDVHKIKDKEHIIYVGPIGECNCNIIDRTLKNGYMTRADALRPVIYIYHDTETNILSVYVLTYDNAIEYDSVETEKEVLNSKSTDITEDISKVEDMNDQYKLADIMYNKLKNIADNIERCKDFEKDVLEASIADITEYISNKVKYVAINDAITVPVCVTHNDDIQALIAERYHIERDKVFYAGVLGIKGDMEYRTAKIAEVITGVSCVPINYPNVYYNVSDSGLVYMYVAYVKKGELFDEDEM